MIGLKNQFGLRKKPRFARVDLDAHLRLAEELKLTLDLLQFSFPTKVYAHQKKLDWNLGLFKNLPIRKRHEFFLEYALAVQGFYVLIMDTLSAYCRVEIRDISETYEIKLWIEDKHYYSNYLVDHICCLIWVVKQVNQHITNSIGERHA
jgi:hypothetical protein